jgi:hypothetical protein
MNDITERQLRPTMLSLVRSRTLIYWRAKRCQAAMLVLTLSLPVFAAMASALMPSARAAIATAAVLIGIFEVTSIDRWMKTRLKEGAKLQEQFDCEVLDIEWNEFLAGAPVDAEVSYEGAHKELSAADEQRLRDWYPTIVANAPLEVARLICQRENLVYDSDLRVVYRRVLFWAVILFIAAVSLFALSFNPTFELLVLGVLVPAAPALTWALRENKRQSDTLETLARLKTESERLLKATLKGAKRAEARARSRELQDAIFNHRLTSSLVFEWLYNFLRPRLESKLVHGAEHWVNEFKRVAQ